MSLHASNAGGLTTTCLLASISAAATANATGTGVDVSEYEGALVFTQNVGLITGTIDGKIVTSDNSNLTSSSDAGTFTQVTASTDPLTQSITIQCSALKKYVGYVGTIVTGPALVGCTMVGSKSIV